MRTTWSGADSIQWPNSNSHLQLLFLLAALLLGILVGLHLRVLNATHCSHWLEHKDLSLSLSLSYI